jgi:hypothetical protein
MTKALIEFGPFGAIRIPDLFFFPWISCIINGALMEKASELQQIYRILVLKTDPIPTDPLYTRERWK